MGAVAFNIVPPKSARALVARAFLGNAPSTTTLGSIELKPHQLAAVDRIQRSIVEFGGAILCDPVGTGKTFTALACSRGRKALVVAPALLKEMWLNAAIRSRTEIEFISLEALSRHSARMPSGHEIIIVDEAHHLRNPATNRYSAISRLIAGRPAVMLTATPVHNRKLDLYSLLRLFLGERAYGLSPAEIARCVIRRDSLSISLQLPSKLPVIWHDLDGDDSIPLLLLSLPPPLPPSDGGDGGALVFNSLIRQWSSSNAALKSALRRRLVQSSALIAALQDGTLPSRRELASWITGEDAVQLSFAGFLASSAGEAASLLPVVESHRDGIVRALRLLQSSDAADDRRASVIDAIRRDHPNERIVAFSSYTATVHAMFSRLAHGGRVAALTSGGAQVAGGRITRAEAIERFAPQASARRAPHKAEEITLLLTTDLLSEGVNLHDASCLIHLDLPWTPARIAQRVGRVVRIGSHHRVVTTHALHPPASAETLIRIEGILRDKESDVQSSRAAPRDDEAIRELLVTWLNDDRAQAPAVTAVESIRSGFVALISEAERMRFIVATGENISDSVSEVLSRLHDCAGAERAVSLTEVARSERRLRDWLRSDSMLEDARSSGATSVRRMVLDRISRLVGTARRHERSQIALLASAARERLRQRLTHDDEQRLRAHLTRNVGSRDWLAQLTAEPGSARITQGAESSIVAMILLGK